MLDVAQRDVVEVLRPFPHHRHCRVYPGSYLFVDAFGNDRAARARLHRQQIGAQRRAAPVVGRGDAGGRFVARRIENGQIGTVPRRAGDIGKVVVGAGVGGPQHFSPTADTLEVGEVDGSFSYHTLTGGGIGDRHDGGDRLVGGRTGRGAQVVVDPLGPPFACRNRDRLVERGSSAEQVREVDIAGG